MTIGRNRFRSMSRSDLFGLAPEFGAKVSGDMDDKTLADAVHKAYQAYEEVNNQIAGMDEFDYDEHTGETISRYRETQFMASGEDSFNKMLPSEVADELLKGESKAQAFSYAYRNKGKSGKNNKMMNDVMVALRNAGVQPADVFSHLPRDVRESTYVPLPREMKAVLNSFENYNTGNNLGLDIMPGNVDGLYKSDESLLAEYTTPKALGGEQIHTALENLAKSYINKRSYKDADDYESDVVKLAGRFHTTFQHDLQGQAITIAQRVQANEKYKAEHIGAAEENLQLPHDYVGSYADILPKSVKDERFKDIQGARLPAKGAAMGVVRNRAKGIAAIYGYTGETTNKQGVTGLLNAPVISKHSDLIDSISRETDPNVEYLTDGYNKEGQIKVESELSQKLKAVTESEEDWSGHYYDFVGPKKTQLTLPTPKVEDAEEIVGPKRTGFASPTAKIKVKRRRPIEGKNYDAQPLQVDPDIVATPEQAAAITEPEPNPITYHNVKQNTPEWDALRGSNVTASMAGSLLGSNKHESAIEAVFNAVGYNPSGVENIFNNNFERGHKFEDIGRDLYEKKYNTTVRQTGFVTNEAYPGLGVSPDGLVGDRGLTEFKAPSMNKFFDPSTRKEYLDQVQMQMHIADKDWTDLVQVGGARDATGKEYNWLGRVDRIHRDPEWAANNAERLQGMGAIIQEGKNLHSYMQAGNMSKEEFIEIMSKAVAKGNVEGAEILKDRRENNIDRTAPNLAYAGGRPVGQGYQMTAGGGGNGSGGEVPPSGGNWAEPNEPLRIGGPVSQEEDADFEHFERVGDREFRDQMKILREQDDKAQREADKAKEKRTNQMKDIASVMGGGGSAIDKAMDALAIAQPEIGVPLKLGAKIVGGLVQGINAVNEQFGSAADVGIDNVSVYTRGSQDLEMMGASAQQAQGMMDNFGSAAAQLSVGNPGQAANMVTGSRGLITFDDIRKAKSADELVELASKRAHARGLTEQQFSALMAGAGLNGAARSYDLDETQWGFIHNNRNKEMSDADAETARHNNSALKEVASNYDPNYAVMNLTEEAYSSTDMVGEAITGLQSATAWIDKKGHAFGSALSTGASQLLDDFGAAAKNGALHLEDVAKAAYVALESGGKDVANRDKPQNTAAGIFQVTNATALDKSLEKYGVMPANLTDDGRSEHDMKEKDRVGKQRFNYFLNSDRYGHDPIAAITAMHEGMGYMDKLYDKYGKGWEAHITDPELNQYLKGIHQNFGKGLAMLQQGADANGFNQSKADAPPPQQLNVKVDVSRSTAGVNVSLNGKQVKKATVNLNPGGHAQTVVS